MQELKWFTNLLTEIINKNRRTCLAKQNQVGSVGVKGATSLLKGFKSLAHVEKFSYVPGLGGWGFNSEDISDVTSTVTHQQKAIKTKEMTIRERQTTVASHIYFTLKPGGKLEYQDNASLSKFKGNPSVDT